jgi:predicted DNA-binding transcriptional regulator YafY
VLKASARILRLLSLLQARREWSGAELAERLEVDVRTVRRDVDRLRALDYAIEASAGPGGGYRLGPGAATPPLLLEDDEAVAVAVALGAAAATVVGLEQIALRVLVKLDQLLPARLRRRLSALQAVTLALGPGPARVEPRTLMGAAAAARDQVRLRFRYRDQHEAVTAREVEPMRLVHTGRVWYLVAWDTGRDDWRTFRLDRIDAQAGLARGERFVPREPPGGFSAYVARAMGRRPSRRRARLTLPLPLAEARRRVPAWVGALEADGERASVLTVSADGDDGIAALAVLAGAELTLREPAEAAGALREAARRLLRAVRPPRSRRAPRGTTDGAP